MRGDDLILVTAIEAGEYKIAVEPANPKALPGRYAIKLTEIRPTVSQDNQINAAAREIERIAEESDALRAQGTREGRMQALEKFQEIVRLSKIKQNKIWEIVAVISSGFICNQLGEIQKTLDFYLRGLQLSREAGNREYEGTALNNLGNSYKTIGDYEQSIFYLNQSLAIAREVGDLDGEAISLNNLGGCYLLLGDTTKAEELFGQALVLKREIKDQKGEGNILNNLGQTFAQRGERERAIDFLRQTLTLRRSISDRQGEAVTLLNLGRSFRDAGEAAQAFENLEQSNALARQLGDRRVEADGFYWLAVVERGRGNLPKAIENIENGLQIIERIRGELINPELRTTYFSTVQQFYKFYTDLLVARYEKSKDAGDIALALQASANPNVKVGDFVLAKRNNENYWTAAEVTKSDAKTVEVKTLSYNQTMNLSPEQVVAVRPATVEEFKKVKVEQGFESKVSTMRPKNPAGYEIKKGDKVVVGWSGNSWYAGTVGSISGEKARIKWGNNFNDSDVDLTRIAAYPKMGSAGMPIKAGDIVLVKSTLNTSSWEFAEATSDHEVKYKDGKTRTVRGDEYILFD